MNLQWTGLAKFSSVFLRLALGSLSCLPSQTGLASGCLWTAQCGVGQLRAVRGPYVQAQLVFASGGDSGVSVYRHGCGNSLWSFACARLENSRHCFAKRSSSDYLRADDDHSLGSKGATQRFGLFGCWGSAAPGDMYRFPVQPG